MPLPVSVVIPHLKTRAQFFETECLPSVQANDPSEIIIAQAEGNACEKRNAGAHHATQPYLFFADDDSILLGGALKKMVEALEGHPEASFAYSDTLMVLYAGVDYPHPAGPRRAQPWNYEALRRGNYVETMSLMRKAIFPGFDVAIRRFQDWDLWLTLAGKGHRGVYIPEVLFELHHFDEGISASVPFQESLDAIKKKHRL